MRTDPNVSSMKGPKIEHKTDHPRPGILWASNGQDVGMSEQNEQKASTNEQRSDRNHLQRTG
jgi:hypothetical protein